MKRISWGLFVFVWAALTLAGNEIDLARGKKVFYAVEPDNPKDSTPSKLTDGKINLPPGARRAGGDYFDESRRDYTGKGTMSAVRTVGWHWAGSKDTEYGLAIAVDLEKTGPVGKIRLRAASLTRSMYRFSLPREFIAAVSTDGQDFYQVGTVCKVTSSGMSHLQPGCTALKVRETRNFWQTIEFDARGAEARYVGIIVKPEGFMFYLDELEVFSAPADAAADRAVRTPENRIPFSIGHGLARTDSAVFRPYENYLAVPEDGLCAPEILYFRDFRRLKGKRDYRFEITLPAGVELVRTPLLAAQFKITQSETKAGGRHYLLTVKAHPFKANLGRLLNAKYLGPFYFRSTGPVTPGSSAHFALSDGKERFTPVSVPVRTVKFPVVRADQPFSASITWMPEVYSMDWPDFLNVCRNSGFNSVPFFPYYWETMRKIDPAAFSEETMKKRADRVRQAGLQVIQVESALHAMIWKGEIPCTYPGARRLCLSYRGERYQQYLKRLEGSSRTLRPEIVVWDIELAGASIGGNPANIAKCERCAAGMKRTGLGPQQYLYRCGEELYREMRAAHAAGCGKPFRLGQYDVFAGQPAYHRVWRFRENYPEILQLSMPALYSAGLFDVNHRRVRQQYKALGRNFVTSAWVTPGVYGYCAPEKMEHLVYEHVLNGGNLMIYSIYELRTPMQLYYFACGFKTLSAFTGLLRRGKPDPDYSCGNPALAATRFSAPDEELIYVANYSSPEKESFELDLPAGGVEVRSGKKLAPGKHRFSLASVEMILIHSKRKQTKGGK